MAPMKVEDIRAMSDDQREDAVLNLKKERFNLRFQRATGQLENTSRLREARLDFALAFGSCSFEEPRQDLEEAGWR